MKEVPSRFHMPFLIAATRLPSSPIAMPVPVNEPCEVELGLSFMLYVRYTIPYLTAFPETVTVPPVSESSRFNNLPLTL
ncbi:MAG: hypothetical protein QNL97_08105 [Pseudomonadales bacterium]